MNARVPEHDSRHNPLGNTVNDILQLNILKSHVMGMFTNVITGTALPFHTTCCQSDFKTF